MITGPEPHPPSLHVIGWPVKEQYMLIWLSISIRGKFEEIKLYMFEPQIKAQTCMGLNKKSVVQKEKEN